MVLLNVVSVDQDLLLFFRRNRCENLSTDVLRQHYCCLTDTTCSGVYQDRLSFLKFGDVDKAVKSSAENDGNAGDFLESNVIWDSHNAYFFCSRKGLKAASQGSKENHTVTYFLTLLTLSPILVTIPAPSAPSV